MENPFLMANISFIALVCSSGLYISKVEVIAFASKVYNKGPYIRKNAITARLIDRMYSNLLFCMGPIPFLHRPMFQQL